ncbi:MAG TPA: hypothetical protein DC057_17330 [Spirochaetia bacterium]|nr:hypothetical protein [Spirochaetia bacterium]
MAEKLKNYLSDFIFQLQSSGRYSFTLDELKKKYKISKTAIQQSLLRLSKKGKILSVRKRFYIIIPPEYSAKGMLPPPLFIDELMSFIKKPYYAGLLSAASLHGSGSQQPQDYYIITNMPPIRSISVKNVRINYISRKYFPHTGIIKIKTDTGYINASGPELTCLDLINYFDNVGGLGRCVDIVNEMLDKLKPEAIKKILKNNIPNASIQRFGYILEEILKKKNFAEIFYEKIKNVRTFPTPLQPKISTKKNSQKNRWNIIVNTNLSVE